MPFYHLAIAIQQKIQYSLLLPYPYYTKKTPVFTIKFTLNFFLPPFRSALLPVLLSALVRKLPLKILLVVADYLGIRSFNSGYFDKLSLCSLSAVKFLLGKHEHFFFMEWVERLNQSLNYIEEHLTGRSSLFMG